MYKKLSLIPNNIRQYMLITGNYWCFTLTDGALRMLVILHFYGLGYSALNIALLFLFYEFFGIVTNLIGGWLGARIGLNRTMNIGLGLQVIALSMLLVPSELLVLGWVMAAQALSGIAKDLNKMSAKSAIKQLVEPDQQSRLFRWIALLTGSKNTLKGIGYFLGGFLLAVLGFTGAVAAMAAALCFVWLASLMLLQPNLGKAKNKVRFRQIFSSSRAINQLAAARLFLFGARDIWFVVALPVYLSSQLSWSQPSVGAFMAFWIIGYGAMQAATPLFTIRADTQPGRASLVGWALVLMLLPCAIALALSKQSIVSEFNASIILVAGLIIFGLIFAINSAVHSYLVVRYAKADGASLDVGFYYMANAAGRLIGTVLSGALFQISGLVACLIGSAIFIGLSAVCAAMLPKEDDHPQSAQ